MPFKTQLPNAIHSIEGAKGYLKALFDNNEAYHLDDNANGIDWAADSPTPLQAKHMNELRNQIYSLAYGTEFDPCGFLLELDPEYVAARDVDIKEHEAENGPVPKQLFEYQGAVTVAEPLNTHKKEAVSAKAFFCINESPAFEGYYNPEYDFGGWKVPGFKKEIMQVLVTMFNDDNDHVIMTWHGVTVIEYDSHNPDIEPVVYRPQQVTFEGETITLYYFEGYCWQLDDENKVTEQDARDFLATLI